MGKGGGGEEEDMGKEEGRKGKEREGKLIFLNILHLLVARPWGGCTGNLPVSSSNHAFMKENEKYAACWEIWGYIRAWGKARQEIPRNIRAWCPDMPAPSGQGISGNIKEYHGISGNIKEYQGIMPWYSLFCLAPCPDMPWHSLTCGVPFHFLSGMHEWSREHGDYQYNRLRGWRSGGGGCIKRLTSLPFPCLSFPSPCLPFPLPLPFPLSSSCFAFLLLLILLLTYLPTTYHLLPTTHYLLHITTSKAARGGWSGVSQF